jgi:AI-2 transport protein TqsA
LLVDIDPQARWADALLRASAKEPDPGAPPVEKRKRGRRRRHAAAAEPDVAPAATSPSP